MGERAGAPTAETDRRVASSSAPSVDGSLAAMLLPSVLSLTAGSVDVISFLGLGGLFTAHITGNLVILAAHMVDGGRAPLAPMLSVPVFMVALALSSVLAWGLEEAGLASLRPLLALQFVMLVGAFVLCVAAGSRIDPGSSSAIVAGMLGVAAMAVQNALAQVSLRGAPATAVMTTNITRLLMDVGAMALAREPRDVSGARSRAKHTWPAVVGFALGCGLGALCEAAIGLWSLALPAGFALLALALGCSVGVAGDARR
jgi:uncharacterized membrane protein YoaK (UPF0700 family)